MAKSPRRQPARPKAIPKVYERKKKNGLAKSKTKLTASTKRSQLNVDAPGHDIPDAHLAKEDDLLEIVTMYIANRSRTATIRQAIYSWAGRKVDRARCNNVIAAAKKKMIEYLEVDPREHRAKSLHFYESIIANEDIPDQFRIKAQELLDKSLGLDRGQAGVQDPDVLANLINSALKDVDDVTDSNIGEEDDD